ncbi:autotransporter domain-containing protein [Lichenihabitans sp. Uapishka_5]|uniref:autotransporter family protein n=1 Tax=Lichenihabitans sp. Uapishka_5 TaxID=3037302 RepID=UPI0029E81024|nr:autotransporter domain-containing protein [Lichenihabitans sp. Uapishka_5]MDX7952386.1 autotransporter domain-containing protein [Lichenihabitans sp. Uapishka_5]
MRFASSTSLIALTAALAASSAAMAQSANITPANVNVLNLLSPFLALNASAVGVETLQNSLNGTVATNNGASPAQQALAISDKNLLGGVSTTLGTTAVGTIQAFGVAANLAGGLPNQARPAGSAVTPSQPVGAYGSLLGPLYVQGVQNGTAGPLGTVVRLLTGAYTFTSSDLGVAKNYFANGAATNPSVTPPGYVATPAVAPPGYTLPRFGTLPNPTSSVIDLAYGVTNTQAGQDVYGSSRPVQVAPNRINAFDPTALNGLATNPSFPSGHTTYAYTDGILLAMLTPSLYQSAVLRASEYGNSRIVLGVHYPLDIIGARALASYDLAQAFTNPLYINNAATTGSALNLPTLFTAAQAQLSSTLAAGCGATVATCAASAANTANDPYTASAANQALYRQRLTYGLPTLSFAAAPQEAAPLGGPEASILLATLYGGSTSAARAIAPNGGLDGALQTSTINQILVNTETNALAAFYGTPLSYWTRIDLYSAAGYFGGTTGTLTMASADRLTIPVTIGGGSTLYGNGATLNGTVTALAGGTFGGGSATGTATTTVNGTLRLQPGSTYAVTAANGQASATTVNGQAVIGGSALRVTTLDTALPFTQAQVLTATGGISGTFGSVNASGAVNPFVGYGVNATTLTLDRTDASFAPLGASLNQARIAGALTAGAAQVRDAATGAVVNAAYLNNLSSAALGGATLDRLGGEGLTGTENATFAASRAFTGSITDAMNSWRSPTAAAPNGVTLVAPQPGRPLGYAEATPLPFPVLKGPLPVAPAPQRLWRAWGGGFGASGSIDGSADLGTARQTNEAFGGLVGLDYQVQPNLLLGAAAGGSGADFRVPDRATSGTVTGGHGALYGIYGGATGFYAEGSLAFSGFSNDVRRTAGAVGGLAGEAERSSFDSFEVRVRGEVGQRLPFNGAGYDSIGVTPFAAVEFANLSADGFRETGAGSGLLSLAVAGRDTESLPVFTGVRVDGLMPVGTGMVARPFVQVAYVHELEPTRNLEANFVSLPRASFLVEGARPAKNGAEVKVGADLTIRPGVTLTAHFDGEFSGVQQVYGGRGGLRVDF